MRFYTKQHLYSCGIDLHARTMSLGLLNYDGEIVFHRHMPSTPAFFLKAIAPSREDIVVGVEFIFTWDWLADVCAQEQIPFVLGHALSMKAIHGGQGQTRQDRRPQDRRPPPGRYAPQGFRLSGRHARHRDLLRRRLHLRRNRSELLAHIQTTTSQSCLPPFGKKIAYRKNGDGGSGRFADPSVGKSMEMDVALLDPSEKLLHEVELPLTQTAKVHDINACSRLRSVPGIGKSLALGNPL